MKIKFKKFEKVKSVPKMYQKVITMTHSKHIEVRYHWICDAVRKGLIFLSHISSDLNISDILTKPLDRNAHTRLTSALGLS